VLRLLRSKKFCLLILLVAFWPPPTRRIIPVPITRSRWYQVAITSTIIIFFSLKTTTKEWRQFGPTLPFFYAVTRLGTYVGTFCIKNWKRWRLIIFGKSKLQGIWSRSWWYPMEQHSQGRGEGSKQGLVLTHELLHCTLWASSLTQEPPPEPLKPRDLDEPINQAVAQTLSISQAQPDQNARPTSLGSRRVPNSPPTTQPETCNPCKGKQKSKKTGHTSWSCTQGTPTSTYLFQPKMITRDLWTHYV
jgi:hypothetical protein